MRREVVVAITNGSLDDSTELVEVFGPWEQIFYGEFDRRRRKLTVPQLELTTAREPVAWDELARGRHVLVERPLSIKV